MVSARLSGRVVEPDANDLRIATGGADSGAEATQSVAPLRRVGRRELERRRTKLSDRDWAVIHSVDACHYLQTGHVERMWFQGTGMTPLAAARGSRRTLARLHREGIIRHLERRVGGVRAGSAAYAWTLTETGARLLGQRARRRQSEPGVRHLDHVLAVAEVVVRLHEAARRDELQIVAIETEPTSWRPVVTPHGGREWLKPDLRVTLGVGEFELHWWVEVDNATEHRPTLARKAEAYLRAWREGGEQRRAGVTPRVLWLTPTPERQQVVAGVMESVGAPPGMFVISTSADGVVTLSGRRG